MKLLLLFMIGAACELCEAAKGAGACQKRIAMSVCNRYERTTVPNMFGHKSQEEALVAFNNQYLHLYYTGCHHDLAHVLCAQFFPNCASSPPCRTTCENVKQKCEPLLKMAVPESQLVSFGCELFPEEVSCARAGRHLEHGLTEAPPTQLADEVTCGWDQYRCGDGLGCVPLSQRCDGLIDCSDMTDETSCGHCSSNAFQCGNGKCINHLQTCDGHDNCGDGSDEANCERDNLIQSLINDMLMCDCSDQEATVPSYTDLCITQTILRVRVIFVKQTEAQYKYKFRVEKVLKGDKNMRGKLLSYEMMKIDGCNCRKDQFAKKSKLFVSGLVSSSGGRKKASYKLSDASVGSFVVATKLASSREMSSQIRDCKSRSRNFSRSLNRFRVRQVSDRG